jgi:crossover junction endodeoxyribonuclease RuvC
MSLLRVIGIDPGSFFCGYGVVELDDNKKIHHLCSGVLEARKDVTLYRRLSTLYRGLTEIIDIYKPHEAAIEKVFFAKSVKSALSLGHARGIALLAVAEADLTLFEYSPNEVKKAVVGYGKADKSQVQSMIKALLSLKELPSSDSADALAVALCHINTMRHYCPK